MEERRYLPSRHVDDPEAGVIGIAVVMAMLPIALVMMAFVTTMANRTSRLVDETKQERALLACEAGVDEAIYRAGVGNLFHEVEFTRTLSNGFSYTVKPTHLLVDGNDNDDDEEVDEADEDVFQIVVTGTYQKVSRRVAAYLGPVANTTLPSLEGAITMQNATMTIQLAAGNPLISGTNRNLDGSPGDPAQSRYGITAAPPATLAGITDELTGSEPGRVTGLGPSPSVTSGAAINLTNLVDEVRNTASVVLPAVVNGSTTIGDAAAGDYRIMYRDGDLRLGGTATLSGILVVTGDLDLKGTVRFNGVIVCLGNISNSAGTADIFGGVILGPDSDTVELRGTSKLRYSQQAIDGVMNVINGTEYVAFNGWQELPRN